MSIAVYSPGRFTHAGQGAVICLPLSYAQLLVPPHYTRVKLRGDLIKSSLHHRQYPLACQVKLLIHQCCRGCLSKPHILKAPSFPKYTLARTRNLYLTLSASKQKMNSDSQSPLIIIVWGLRRDTGCPHSDDNGSVPEPSELPNQIAF